MGAVASLLGVVAVGCSAESGAPEAEIGSTSEALNAASATANLANAVEDLGGSTDITDPVAREWSASCEIRNGGAGSPFVKLLVGGFAADGSALGDAYMNKGDGNAWAKVSALPSGQERGFAKMIQVPGAPDKCVLVGGADAKSGGTLLTHAYVFTADGDEGSWADAGAMTGRIFHDLFVCGSNRVMAVGGHTAFGSPIASGKGFEVWNLSTTWTAKADLDLPVSAFGLAVKSPLKIAIAGGVPNGAASTPKIQSYTISNDTSCDVTHVQTQSVIQNENNTNTASGRFGNIAFFDSDSEDLYVAYGTEVPGTGGLTTHEPTDLQQFINVFSGTLSLNAKTSSAVDATRFPTYDIDETNLRLYVAGGEAQGATLLAQTPTAVLNEINLSTIAVDKTGPLATARLGAPVTYVSTSDKVLVSTGLTSQTNTLTTTAEIATPR
jgi:hypothetical protein